MNPLDKVIDKMFETPALDKLTKWASEEPCKHRWKYVAGRPTGICSICTEECEHDYEDDICRDCGMFDACEPDHINGGDGDND